MIKNVYFLNITVNRIKDESLMTMKTAIKGNQLIHLSNLNRSTYQQLFEESKKGQWQCQLVLKTFG